MELTNSIEEVLINAEDFSRVILNLYNNAFNAMREESNFNGKAPNSKDYKPKLRVRRILENGKVITEIGDNGTGISYEIKNNILHPF